jgi:hypothetical protein
MTAAPACEQLFRHSFSVEMSFLPRRTGVISSPDRKTSVVISWRIDQPMRVNINHTNQLQKAFCGRDICQIKKQLITGAIRRNIPIRNVIRDR